MKMTGLIAVIRGGNSAVPLKRDSGCGCPWSFAVKTAGYYQTYRCAGLEHGELKRSFEPRIQQA